MTIFPQEPFESVGGSKHNVKRIIPPKGFLGLAALAGEPLVVGSVENREVPGPEG